jgi:uncharacterized protein
MTQKASPTLESNRIISLDILRGFALLGIFIMNMISFSMVGANYMNPMAEGVIEGDAWNAFVFTQIFANTKFMSLFSILFGAGIVLFSDRIALKGLSEVMWHYRRNFWLLVIGLCHAYLIWYGDILVSYAFCSVWLFLFRKWKAKPLFIASAVFYLIGAVITQLAGWSIPYWEASELAELCNSWTPSPEVIADEIEIMRGSWLEQTPLRAEISFAMQTFIFMVAMVWKITSMMLLGMGLYKSGIIIGAKSAGFYKKLAVVGVVIGVSMGVLDLYMNSTHGYSCEYSFFIGSQYLHFGAPAMVMGYIGLLMWMCKGHIGEILAKWLAPVGQIALTNYLMQSLIATTIFYGHGFALYGTLGRAQHWLVILPVWAFQIVFSRWWLSKYKFGPAEWAWRSLTYWRKQVM